MPTLLDTMVTGAGLVDLKAMTGLSARNLWDTRVTAAGVADLKTALPNTQISK